jgi:ribonucleotide monophosphatase NagD (HAD superfamily)
MGKPFRPTYEFAEKTLLRHRDTLFATNGPRLKKVYMIGDNPESDIRGANTFDSPTGVEWISLLVKTGVYKGRNGSRPSWQPRDIVDDVKTAVQYALRENNWHEALK